MDTTLDDDARSLLENLSTPDAPTTEAEDEILWAPPEPTEDAPVERAVDSVPRSDYDRLTQQVADMQRQMGEMAAQRFQPQAPRSQDQYTPAPPQPFNKDEFNARFFQDPAAALAQIMAGQQQNTQQQLQPAITATNDSLGRTMVANMRATFAAENPEIAKSVLPDLDRVIAGLPPGALATLVSNGTLETEFRNTAHRIAGEKLVPVYRTAAQRRAAAAAANVPPSIGGGTVTSINERQRPIRASDLSESEKIALEQGKPFGLTVQDIIAQRAYDEVPQRRGAV